MSRVPYVARRLSLLLPQARVFTDAGVAPEEAVVAGLAGIEALSELTLNRPAFDILLDWGSGEQVVYDAYSPLFEPWEVYNGLHELGYERQLRVPDVPASGQGLLRFLTTSGEHVPIDLDGAGTIDGFPVRFGPHQLEFVLGCDGLLAFSDGAGEITQVRTAGWPVPFAGASPRLTLEPA
jgi:hypothetical protein